MQFCQRLVDGKRCDTRLRFRLVKTELKTIPALACDRCGFYVQTKVVDGEKDLEEARSGSGTIKVVSAEAARMHTMPTAQAECPKCGNREAYWWFLQTRGGDEPTTQFYRCTKCDHTWRHYA